MTTIVWLKPVTVVQIAFTEWTQDANLRHAAFVALRTDKAPREVARQEASSLAYGRAARNLFTSRMKSSTGLDA